MSLREKIDRHPGLVFALSVAAILVVVSVLAWPWIRNILRPPRAPATAAYYFDLSKNEVFVGPLDLPVPAVRPGQSDPGVVCVRAYVFSCGKCEDASSRFVGYLFKLSDDYKKLLDASPETVRQMYRAPAVFDFEAHSLPQVVDLKARAAASQPVKRAVGERVRFSEPPSSTSSAPQWKILGARDSGAWLGKLKARCGRVPSVCEPSPAEK